MSTIPKEALEKIKEKFPVETSWNVMDTSGIQRHAAYFGYQLATDWRDQITTLKSSLKEKESRISGLVFATEQWEKKYDAKEKECEELKRASHELAKMCEDKMGQNLNLCLQIVGLKEILKRCRDVIDMECDDHEFIIEIDNNLNQVL